MNLNFYNDGNNYNPYLGYTTQQNPPTLVDLQNQLNRLRGDTTQNTQTNNMQQPYYLFCGNKTEWDEFLLINYGITEKNIFDDYKLFLQAKQELLDEQGKDKLNTMKNKLQNKDTQIDSSIKSNIGPKHVQPNNNSNFTPNYNTNDTTISAKRNTSAPTNRNNKGGK